MFTFFLYTMLWTGPRSVAPLFYLLTLVSKCTGYTGLDELTLLNPPQQPVSSYPLRVRYSCSKSAVVHLDLLVSSDTAVTSQVFQRQWNCEPGPPRIRLTTLRFPDHLVYRADWRILHSESVLAVMLRAWIVVAGSPSHYQTTPTRVLVQLEPIPAFSQPLKQHQLCPRWDIYLLWRIHGDTIPQCPVEEEVAHFLSFLFSSTGENFGITRTLHRYGNKVLENHRLKSISFPWCLFSTWLYLIQPCKQRLCSILHHIDSTNSYATPAVFLTNSGHLHIQVAGEHREPAAFMVNVPVPMATWCRIHVEIRGRLVSVTVACVDGEEPFTHSVEHRFRDPLLLDDTDGYFILGGSPFVIGIEGFYGPSLYYRRRMMSSASELQPKMSLPEVIREVNLTGWYQSCQQFQDDLRVKMSEYILRVQQDRQSENFLDIYKSWVSRKEALAAVSQCKLWEVSPTSQRYQATRLMQALVSKHGVKEVKLASVGRALYSSAFRKLIKKGPTIGSRKVMPHLLQAGCLGDQRALYLSSVLYNTGLGVKKHPSKARLLCLLAAQQDWRLALLHLGHLHHLGEQELPPDPALSYAYYSNIAAQTSSDKQNPSSQQKFVEVIHLNDEDTLKIQTHEHDDLFLWLKLQARRGVAEAEQALGRMLFWGQQGVSPDLQTAAKHYERGAVNLEDPVSMYDYAVILLKGQGVKQDIPKAVTFLKKAVEQNFVPAINALGWYYERYEQDYVQAVKLWEKADALGNAEAAVNLGVFHAQGLYPGKPPDQFAAYTYYLKSAQRRHIDGAIHLAEVWIKGIPGQVNRLPLDAVLWAKWVSEQNGFLGAVLRTALDAYLRQHWSKALVWYLLAAESGFASAQFNMAYLCEQNPGGLLDDTFVTECMWRYYNLSIQAQDPSAHALVKMGDLVYSGSEQKKRDVAMAANLYKRAAIRNDPQGWYSLGLLVWEGEVLPWSVVAELGLWDLHGADNYTVLCTLFRRCRDHGDMEAFLPCSLALFHTQIQSIWNLYGLTVSFFSAVAMAAACLLVLLYHQDLRTIG